MHLIIKARELYDLGLWEKFAKLRKIRSPDSYLWGVIENDEFELTSSEIRKFNIDIAVDSKHRKDIGVLVTCNCCKVRFSIFVADIDKFWFCPSCGDKLGVT